MLDLSAFKDEIEARPFVFVGGFNSDRVNITRYSQYPKCKPKNVDQAYSAFSLGWDLGSVEPGMYLVPNGLTFELYKVEAKSDAAG